MTLDPLRDAQLERALDTLRNLSAVIRSGIQVLHDSDCVEASGELRRALGIVESEIEKLKRQPS